MVPAHIRDRIDTYHRTYRHPSLIEPQVSGLYSLFPHERPGSSHELCWPKTWPNADRPGVYLIFSKELELLYIGKAAVIGSRLGVYFQYDHDGLRGCKVVHDWSVPPALVVTVALGEAFEAPSLEEYLITELNPPDNKTWTAK